MIGAILIKVVTLVTKYFLNFTINKVHGGAKREGSHLFSPSIYLSNEAFNQKMYKNKSFSESNFLLEKVYTEF